MTEALMSSVVTEGARVDWERVIIDIQRSTWLAEKSQRKSLKAIGHACGRGDTWAWSLKNIPGTQPTFHDGLMLLTLDPPDTEQGAWATDCREAFENALRKYIGGDFPRSPDGTANGAEE